MENPNSEGRLFTNWLTEVYGKNRTQKFMDYICSLDGLQTGLDVVGMFIPGVDAVNAFIYFVRGDYASCILTMATMGSYIPEFPPLIYPYCSGSWRMAVWSIWSKRDRT